MFDSVPFLQREHWLSILTYSNQINKTNIIKDRYMYLIHFWYFDTIKHLIRCVRESYDDLGDKLIL